MRLRAAHCRRMSCTVCIGTCLGGVRILRVFGFPPRRRGLTAATFERVVRHWGRFDPPARATYVDPRDRAEPPHRHYRRGVTGRPSLDEHPELAEGSATARTSLTSGKFETLKGWLSPLDPREREVIALRYGADLSTADIAAACSASARRTSPDASRALGGCGGACERGDQRQRLTGLRTATMRCSVRILPSASTTNTGRRSCRTTTVVVHAPEPWHDRPIPN